MRQQTLQTVAGDVDWLWKNLLLDSSKQYIGNCEFLSKIILNDRTNENNPNVVESMYEAVPYRTYQPKMEFLFNDQSESVI